MPWQLYPMSNLTPIPSNSTLSVATRLSACCREEKYLLHLPGIKPSFLSRPYPSMVTTPNEISLVPSTIEAINIGVDFANPNIRTCFIIFFGWGGTRIPAPSSPWNQFLPEGSKPTCRAQWALWLDKSRQHSDSIDKGQHRLTRDVELVFLTC